MTLDSGLLFLGPPCMCEQALLLLSYIMATSACRSTSKDSTTDEHMRETSVDALEKQPLLTDEQVSCVRQYTTEGKLGRRQSLADEDLQQKLAGDVGM